MFAAGLIEDEKLVKIPTYASGWEDDVPTTRVHIAKTLDEIAKTPLTLERLITAGLQPAWRSVELTRTLIRRGWPGGDIPSGLMLTSEETPLELTAIVSCHFELENALSLDSVGKIKPYAAALNYAPGADPTVMRVFTPAREAAQT